MLDTLAEGAGWVVVNKPAGIATEKHFQYDTLEARAREQWARPGARKPAFVGIVHRLDRVTSGALVLARRKSTLAALNALFAAGKHEKTYLAVTERRLPSAEGQLRHYLTRTPDRKLAVASSRPIPGGRDARLTYRLISKGAGAFLYAIWPVTGRFHQIRCQLSASGAPIFGDQPYGGQRLLGAHRIALHARSLTFPEPGEEGTVQATAPLPEYWPIALPAAGI